MATKPTTKEKRVRVTTDVNRRVTVAGIDFAGITELPADTVTEAQLTELKASKLVEVELVEVDVEPPKL